MFNYFYTVEVNLNGCGALQSLVPVISFSKTRFQTVEYTSKIFFSEAECVDTVLKELNEVQEALYRSEPKLVGHEFCTEIRGNPNLATELGLKNASYSLDPEEAAAEKEFWTQNKLALFMLFMNKESDDFLVQFVIYCYEDEIAVDSTSPAYMPGFSTMVN